MKAPLFEQYLFEMTGMEASHDYVVTLLGELSKELENDGSDISKFSLDQIIKGMNTELEHGSMLGNDTNITGNDPMQTLRIALAHLKEDPEYYDKLEMVEGGSEIKQTEDAEVEENEEVVEEKAASPAQIAARKAFIQRAKERAAKSENKKEEKE